MNTTIETTEKTLAEIIRLSDLYVTEFNKSDAEQDLDAMTYVQCVLPFLVQSIKTELITLMIG